MNLVFLRVHQLALFFLPAFLAFLERSQVAGHFDVTYVRIAYVLSTKKNIEVSRDSPVLNCGYRESKLVRQPSHSGAL